MICYRKKLDTAYADWRNIIFFKYFKNIGEKKIQVSILSKTSATSFAAPVECKLSSLFTL